MQHSLPEREESRHTVAYPGTMQVSDSTPFLLVLTSLARCHIRQTFPAPSYIQKQRHDEECRIEEKTDESNAEMDYRLLGIRQACHCHYKVIVQMPGSHH